MPDPGRIMLPIDGNTGTTDFNSNSTNLGWVPMDAGRGLVDISQRLPAQGNADHAIPSPIAHIKNFKTKLDADDPAATAEWQGMLAAIALRQCCGLNITVKTIQLGTAASTVLQRVLLDELSEYKDANWPTVQNAAGQDVPASELYVFCLSGTPFAMLIPGMVICPFKNYPANLFDSLAWCPNGEWTSVANNLGSVVGTLSIASQELYWYLDELETAFKNYPAITKFKNSIPVPAGIGVPTNKIPPVGSLNAPGIFTADQQFSRLTAHCPPPPGAPGNVFSDKVLVIVPQDNIYDQNNYQIDYNGSSLTPIKCSGLCTGGKYVYIVPPVHPDVVKSIQGGFSVIANLSAWVNNDSIICTFDLFFANGMKISYKNTYASTSIVWAADMPYISLWPNVDIPTWKEYFVAVVNHDPKEPIRGDQNLQAFNSLISMKGCRRITGTYNAVGGNHISNPELDVSVICADRVNSTSYSCSSEYGPRSFNMIRSEGRPYAINLGYRDAGFQFSLGCWIIPSNNTIKSNGVPAGIYNIGVDFGTTSTNVYIRDTNGGVARSIVAPGKFLLDIFNPYIYSNGNGTVDNSVADFIQKYYLFGSETGDLNKIFTYGQKFSALDSTGAAVAYKTNISGRYLAVDASFLASNASLRNTGIYYPLKFPEATGKAMTAIDEARVHFLAHLLKCALLDARVSGATGVRVYFSYPFDEIKKKLSNDMAIVLQDLSDISGFNLPTVHFETEAKSAGYYYINVPGGVQGVSPNSGYVIIDIGGGTTDVSVWKDPNGGTDAQLIDEKSFFFAGDYLVRRSIVRTISSEKDFRDLWQPTGTVADNAVNNYTGYNIGMLGVSTNPPIDYVSEAAKVDFILEKCPVSYGKLISQQYQNFTSAVQIKYYALMYVIANYLKKLRDEGKIDYAPYAFSICLAGCGSKGIRLTRDPNFTANLISIFSDVLGVTLNLVPPITDDKKEVAAGITYVVAAAAPDEQNVPTQSSSQVVPSPTNKNINDIWELLDAIKKYNMGDPLFGTISSKNPTDGVSVYLNKVVPAIKGLALTLGCDADIIDNLVALRAIDALIDNFC